MDLDQLFFDESLQRHIISDASRDVAALLSTKDALIGCFSTEESPLLGKAPLRPAFMIDFCNLFRGGTPGPAPTLDFDPVLNGPPWGRLWIILTLIAISPSLFEAIRANKNSAQHAWLMGSSAPFTIPGFRERYFKSLCGSFNGGKIETNCKTPIEIISSELFIYSILNRKQ